MKNHIIRTLAAPALVGMLFAAGAAQAEPSDTGREHGRAFSHGADADGAEKLCDDGEGHGKRRGHRGKHGGKRFARHDQNGDGFLTKDEVGAERWERIKVADANADKRVSKDEMKAARKDGKLGKRHGKDRKAKKGKERAES